MDIKLKENDIPLIVEAKLYDARTPPFTSCADERFSC